MLVKVKATSATRNEIIEIVDIFNANIVDVTQDSLMIEITGDEDKTENLLKLLHGFGIKELARTGRIAMVRGNVRTVPSAAVKTRTKKIVKIEE